MERPSKSQLRKLIGIGNYQFGNGVGRVIFDERVSIKCSRKTGRIRHIFLRDKLIATLRPKDGLLALTVHGADIILSRVKDAPNVVVVDPSVAEAIRVGGDVFAKHVVRADQNLRPGEEVIVTGPDGTLLCYQPYGKEGLLTADIDLSAATGLLASRCKSGESSPS
jgi:archaeosine-15-forming tRNA-guanine transglycosylase